MDPQTDALLKRADDDAMMLHLPGVPEMPFGQHTQAAIEKLLKALINERRGTSSASTISICWSRN